MLCERGALGVPCRACLICCLGTSAKIRFVLKVKVRAGATRSVDVPLCDQLAQSQGILLQYFGPGKMSSFGPFSCCSAQSNPFVQ